MDLTPLAGDSISMISLVIVQLSIKLKNNIMIDLFYMGGPLFMGILTLIFIGTWVAAFRGKAAVKELGQLALAFGFFGQLLGLYGAFEGIESMGGVSQAMLAGGLKVSSITALYGLFIYLVSVVIRTVVAFRAK